MCSVLWANRGVERLIVRVVLPVRPVGVRIVIRDPASRRDHIVETRNRGIFAGAEGTAFAAKFGVAAKDPIAAVDAQRRRAVIESGSAQVRCRMRAFDANAAPTAALAATTSIRKKRLSRVIGNWSFVPGGAETAAMRRRLSRPACAVGALTHLCGAASLPPRVPRPPPGARRGRRRGEPSQWLVRGRPPLSRRPGFLRRRRQASGGRRCRTWSRGTDSSS